MPIYALGDKVPRIDASAFIHPDAVIIGDVTIGPASSVWPAAVLRGDSSHIVVGARTSIQDGAVIHCTANEPTRIGDDVVVGHLAHMEGCTVGNGALVGSGAVVLPRATIGDGALVAAAALVPNAMAVPPGALARGVPARVTPDAAPADVIADSVTAYVEKAATYREQLRRID